MSLMNRAKQAFIVILYIFTIYSTSTYLSDYSNLGSMIKYTSAILIVFTIVILIVGYLNSKTDFSDVLVLLFTYVITNIITFIFFDINVITVIFNLSITVMFAKYFNIENSVNKQFDWINAWTFIGFSIFFFLVFIGIFNFWFSLLFAFIMLYIILREEKIIKSNSEVVKQQVRFETIIFFIGINILFLIQ